MNAQRCTIAAVVALIGTGGCSERPGPTAATTAQVPLFDAASQQETRRHVVVFAAERVPADFAERVTRVGGSVATSLDGIGVATVTGLSEAAAAELRAQSDVRNVERDVVTDPDGGSEVAEISAEESELLAPADAIASPTTAQFYARQWNLRAVFAPEAWAAGHVGSRDVKVAILDTGIDYANPDLAGLVDLDHSISLVPEDVTRHYPGRLPFSDLFWHGTAVASAVASNASILAGVNRYVTLLAVKIADSTGIQTTASRMLEAIVYAADQGVDVINISNGLQRRKSVNPGTIAAFERAVNYAFRKGALVVSLPFNDAADLDHNGDIVRLPCEVANAICVAATGPTAGSSVNGPWVDVDAPAPYTGFGRSAVSVAAPGGAGEVGQFRRFWSLCTTTPSATTGAPACRARQAIAQGAGTSFAAPTVAGLAALLVAQLGHGNPALIRARILQSADDLGDPGTDPYYGKGRINIARALGVIP
jgi:lantibiotic leader peptide-processing serine protease